MTAQERKFALLCTAIAVLLSGCHTLKTVAPPEPALVLLSAAPLQLAGNCEASGSFFVGFTVRTDGRTDALEMPSAPACVRDALTAWVQSFRYSPLAAVTHSGIEWMLVSARRGS